MEFVRLAGVELGFISSTFINQSLMMMESGQVAGVRARALMDAGRWMPGAHKKVPLPQKLIRSS